IDDYGLKPPPSTGAVDLYDVINGRYEKGSIVLTSNRAPDEFTEVWGEPLLAQAGLDRLVHRASVLLITGPSYRLKDTRPPNEDVSRCKPPRIWPACAVCSSSTGNWKPTLSLNAPVAQSANSVSAAARRAGTSAGRWGWAQGA